MKNPKTEKQIEEEVTKLREMKPRVRSHSAFGDDNHAQIEAQIQTLKEGYDEYAIDDNIDEDLREAAQQAFDWATGNEKDSPSDGWKGLIQ